ncbi:MAG: glycosyltransferase [Anaerolineae bacterium]|nr:glycosyltransferase [Anaerolineae bacterium]
MNGTRPIRVMRIIARLNVGGPAIHVVLLTDQLGPPDFESTLVCGHIGPHEGDMAYLADQRGIEPIYINELGRALSPLRDSVTLFKLWRLMRKIRPDVVHTHTAKAGFVGRLAAWLAGVPVRVHTFHGHVFHGYFSPRKTRLFLWLERLTARVSDRLITISPALKDELANTYRIAPEDKFEVVPLGLDLAPYANTPRHLGTFRETYAVPAGAPIVGIVGRIVPIKNHALFLDMASRVRQVMPGAHFAIIGDGECRAEVEEMVNVLNLRGAVTFTGWLQDLTPAFSDMSALVIASHNEGTPTSIIQALAAGMPVVSTAVGGVPDLLQQGEFGRLVPPGDPQALASAVLEAIKTPSPNAESIKRTILDQYDSARLSDNLAGLYRQLLQAKRGKSRS